MILLSFGCAFFPFFLKPVRGVAICWVSVSLHVEFPVLRFGLHISGFRLEFAEIDVEKVERRGWQDASRILVASAKPVDVDSDASSIVQWQDDVGASKLPAFFS